MIKPILTVNDQYSVNVRIVKYTSFFFFFKYYPIVSSVLSKRVLTIDCAARQYISVWR